jgi:hypothetical protein
MRYIRGREGWGHLKAVTVDTADAPATAEPGPCPGCGGPGIPIAFGFPGEELIRAEARGEVILGGCCLPLDPRCPRCNGPLSSEVPWTSTGPRDASDLDEGWL